MTQPLFDAPRTTRPPHPLVEAAKKKVAHLEAQGLLGDGFELETAFLLDLAEAQAFAGKGYAKANLAKVLAEAIEKLPRAAAGDDWDTWADLIASLRVDGDQGTAARYATAANPAAPHDLDAIRATAVLLGTPLMPWQAQVARVASERTPDGRRWRYPVVVVTVPRQSGKTTLLRAIFTQRAICRPESSAWLTAQTGKDATARWKDLVKAIRRSPLAPFVETRLAAGSAAVTFTRNDSTISPFAPTPGSLHGYTTTDVAIDEGFAFTDDEGADLQGAINPTQSTIEQSQLWIISTAGNPESTWLKRWVEAGRAAVDDPAATLAYFEWSAPETMDAYAPEAIDFHPARDRTISRAKLAEQAANMPPSEWRRAYLNQWVATTREPIMSADQVNALGAEQPQPLPGHPIGLAYEVSYDRTRSSLYAAWEVDGQLHCRQLLSGPGSSWLPAAITDAQNTLGPDAELVADDGGPTRQITDHLTRLGFHVRTLGAREFATACGSWFARAADGTLTHAHDTDLAAAIAVAQTRAMADSWAISRVHSGAPVDALIAAIVASRVPLTNPETAAPTVVTLDD